MYHQYHDQLCLNGIGHPAFVKKKTVVITMVIVEISTIIALIKIQNAAVRTEHKSF